VKIGRKDFNLPVARVLSQSGSDTFCLFQAAGREHRIMPAAHDVVDVVLGLTMSDEIDSAHRLMP
jgi:hypothetical protein